MNEVRIPDGELGTCSRCRKRPARYEVVEQYKQSPGERAIYVCYECLKPGDRGYLGMKPDGRP